MPVATPAEYASYFLNSASSVVQLETLEISHPAFSKVYYIVRNKLDGLQDAVDENGVSKNYEYYPLRISYLGVRDNLDAGLKIEVGDLGEIIPVELDAVAAAEVPEVSGFQVKPTVIYRTYRSDDLGKVLYGPLVLEIREFTFTKDGAMFEAKAPSLNLNQTGEVYSVTRFPMLRGFFA